MHHNDMSCSRKTRIKSRKSAHRLDERISLFGLSDKTVPFLLLLGFFLRFGCRFEFLPAGFIQRCQHSDRLPDELVGVVG